MQISLKRGGCITLDLLKGKQEEIASIRLQAATRRFIHRTRFLNITKASCILRRAFKRRFVAKVRAREYAASIQIQTVFRARKMRKAFRIRLEEHRGSIRIQKFVRASLAARRYSKTIWASALINRCLRGMVYRRRLANRIYALQSIQCRSRGGREEQRFNTSARISGNGHTFNSKHERLHRARVRGFVTEAAGFTNFVIDIETRHGRGVVLKRIRRRYSQFHSLDQELQQKFKYLPILPPKTWCRNTGKDFVSRRARGLNLYLTDVMEHAGVLKSEALKSFLQIDAGW